LLNKNSVKHKKPLMARLVKMPAETVLFSSSKCFAVRSLTIRRETVIGMPEADIVIKTPITERAI